VYDARGESSSAQRHLAEALQLDPAYGAARIDLARTLIAGKGAGSALKLLDEAPQQQKQSLPVVIQRNWALMAGGNKEEARRGIDRALASSRVSDALLQDAVLKIDGKDYSGARASAEEILRKDPADTRALRVLYDSYAALKQETAGLSKVREYAAKQPNAAAVQQFLGGKLMAAGDAEGARKAFEAARAAKPGWAPAELALAQMDILEGKRDAARQRLSHAVSANPANLPGRLMWADLEVRDGKAAAGIEQYRAVLDRDSRNLTALNNLACLLADSGQQDEALKYAQLAKEIAPDNAAVDDTLGWTYYRKGMYTSALRHLESAAAREATPVRKYHLGMACMKAGDPKRGREILEAALRAAPNLPEAEAAGRLLRGQ
jgi:tetratricopeptide (TPR) repeat protein